MVRPLPFKTPPKSSPERGSRPAKLAAVTGPVPLRTTSRSTALSAAARPGGPGTTIRSARNHALARLIRRIYLPTHSAAGHVGRRVILYEPATDVSSGRRHGGRARIKAGAGPVGLLTACCQEARRGRS